MTEAVVRHENDQRSSRPLGEVDILWLNGVLGCDGESVAMTGATQPSVEDQAVFEVGEGQGRARLAFTTDSYVVTPVFFHGGDIGRLAVCGTVNDLAMSGALPLCEGRAARHRGDADGLRRHAHRRHARRRAAPENLLA